MCLNALVARRHAHTDPDDISAPIDLIGVPG